MGEGNEMVMIPWSLVFWVGAGMLLLSVLAQMFK